MQAAAAPLPEASVAARRALARVFGALDDDALARLEATAEPVELRRGGVLLRQGEQGDSVYILTSGRLRAVREDTGGRARVLGQIEPGESIGEMAMFTGEARNATLYAIRDSLLLRFTREAFERAVDQDPRVLRHLMQVLTERLQRANAGTASAVPKVTNVALVAGGPGVPLADFAARLAAALGARGPTLHLTAERVDSILGIPGFANIPDEDPREDDLISWLGEQEAAHRFLLFEAEPGPTEWTGRCIRQADWVFIAADANADPAPGPVERAFLAGERSAASARRTLLLLHRDASRLPASTRSWLAPRQVDDHLHLRLDSADEFARIARFVDGSAVGLVLGGGGARGFAHIGVLRALREAGVPVDMVAGTSMGAAMAAQYALGWSPERMVEVNRDVWIRRRPHREVTLPLVSLVGNRGATACGRMMYGEAQIEDLWVPFFCVSSSLTRAEMVVHREGPLMTAVTASSSLPGIALPVLDRGDLLVDGALFNNLPGDVMRQLGCGRLLVSNISVREGSEFCCERIPTNREIVLSKLRWGRPPPPYPSIMEIVLRSALLGSIHRQEAVVQDADFCFDPPLDGFGLMEFPALEKIAQAGYEHARQRLAEWAETGALARLAA